LDTHKTQAQEDAATTDLTLPEGACTLWAILYKGLAEFAAEFSEYVRLENDVIFSQFERSPRTPTASHFCNVMEQE